MMVGDTTKLTVIIRDTDLDRQRVRQTLDRTHRSSTDTCAIDVDNLVDRAFLPRCVLGGEDCLPRRRTTLI